MMTRFLMILLFSFASQSLLASQEFIENVEHNNSLQTILQKEFGSTDYKLIEKMERGFSSPGIYKIQVSDKTLVYRVPSIRRSINQCEKEISIMKKATESNISPKIWGTDSKGGILMDFIDSDELDSVCVKKSDSHIQDLGKKLAKLHKLSVDIEKEGISIFNIPKYLLNMMTVKPLICEEAINVLENIERENRDNFESHIIHADLNLNNILYTHKTGFLFVDFEIAGFGDGGFDLATISNYLGFGLDQEETFLTAYYGFSPTNKEKQKFELFKKIHMLYAGVGCIFASQLKNTNTSLSEEEIKNIPPLKEYQKTLGNLFKLDPKNLQKYGYAFLKQALKK